MDDQEKGEDQDEGPTVASEVPFSELCGLLEKISKTQGNDKKKKILKDFIDKWREYHDKLHKGKKDLVCSDSVIETVTGQLSFFFTSKNIFCSVFPNRLLDIQSRISLRKSNLNEIMPLIVLWSGISV